MQHKKEKCRYKGLTYKTVRMDKVYDVDRVGGAEEGTSGGRHVDFFNAFGMFL
ncbi:hypothetical protein DAMNIGENAA_03380 [Desulforhabdus amnigena]|jgi:hypothetical protein|uniref:Uncharacterized protein n=1 Tax=Desulforhabdus amnigena TaxID=40218 RepID=A0A9W6D2B5_9BACT|nr:hypothetical protein DAMNIGENAA_03380 [Desulforhabdus amnigena]